jgi:hypothetical protein
VRLPERKIKMKRGHVWKYDMQYEGRAGEEEL